MKFYFYLFLVFIGFTSQTVNAAEAYAVLSSDYIGDKIQVTFYYDDLRASRTGTKVSVETSKRTPGWVYQSIKKVVFTESFSDYRPTITYRWFYTMSKLTSIEGLEYLNTSEVTDMEEMFAGCRINELDLSHFETGNVVSMAGMFSGCKWLKNLDLSGFDTHNVTDMSHMFRTCSSLISIDLSSFNTSNVTNMTCMFYGCDDLITLNVGNFNTCSVTTMSGMFCNCSNITSLDLHSFDTHNVTTMEDMFNGCKMLVCLDLKNFDTSKVKNMGQMFYNCNELFTIDVSSFDTQNVTSMRYMFEGCYKLIELDISSFDTKNVTDMIDMFSWCSELTTIYASELWSTESVYPAGGRSLFYASSNLVGGAGTIYLSGYVSSAYAHIDGGPDNPGYFTRKAVNKYIDVTIGRLKHATLYYGTYNLRVPEGVMATTYVLENSALQVSKTFPEGFVIPKGTGVVLYGEPNTYRFYATAEAGEMDANNILRGSDEDEVTTGGDKYYLLSTLIGSNGDPSTLGFYFANGHPDGSAFINGAHKAYLALQNYMVMEAKSYYLLFQTDKVDDLVNIPIMYNKTVYNMKGQRVHNKPKGIIIVNGQKMVFK